MFGSADQAEQHDGARVAAPVHEMAEARYLLTAPQQFAHHPGHVLRAAGGG